MVLGGRTHCDTPVSSHGTEDGGIVALGAATREHHFAWRTAEHGRNIVAGFINGEPRATRGTVTARRVGELVSEKRLHRGDRFSAHRCGGCVIEIGDVRLRCDHTVRDYFALMPMRRRS
jgi:hypothetical protein